MSINYLLKMAVVVSIIAIIAVFGIPILIDANQNAINILPEGFNQTVNGNYNIPLVYNLPAKKLANELNKFTENECYEQLPSFNNFFAYYNLQILTADSTTIFRIVDGNGQPLDQSPRIYGKYCLAKSPTDTAEIQSMTLKKKDDGYVITSGNDELATVRKELIEEGIILYKKGTSVCIVVDNPTQFTSLPTCTEYTLKDYASAFKQGVKDCENSGKNDCACPVWLPDVKDVETKIVNEELASRVTFTKGEEAIEQGYSYLFDTQPSDQRNIKVGEIDTPRGPQPKYEYVRFYPKELLLTSNVLRTSDSTQYGLENNFFIFKNQDLVGIGNLAGKRIEPGTANRLGIIDENNINVEKELNLCGALK